MFQYPSVPSQPFSPSCYSQHGSDQQLDSTAYAFESILDTLADDRVVEHPMRRTSSGGKAASSLPRTLQEELSMAHVQGRRSPDIFFAFNNSSQPGSLILTC